MAVTPWIPSMKSVLLYHLEYTFSKEAWQPPLAAVVEGVAATQAAWKPSSERHSIWQIVRHVTLWKQATLKAWEGTHQLFHGAVSTERMLEIQRRDWQEVSGDDAVWHADVRALHDASRALVERVNRLSEEDLLRPFAGEEMPAVLRILRMATHDVYHAGQVRYLRALQGV